MWFVLQEHRPWCVLNWAAGAETWRRRWPSPWMSPDFLFTKKKKNQLIFKDSNIRTRYERLNETMIVSEAFCVILFFNIQDQKKSKVNNSTTVLTVLAKYKRQFRKKPKSESHRLRSAAACTAVQQPHTQRKGYERSICTTVWTFQSFCTRCPNVFSGYIFRG